MVRTRSDCSGVRVGRKAAFKAPPSPSINGSTGRSTKRTGSGNRYCPRDTPAWQKEITQFFNTNASSPNTDEPVPNTSNTSTE